MPPKSLKVKEEKISSSKIHMLKSMMARYLEKGLNVDESCMLCQISRKQLGVLRSDPEFDDFILKCESQLELECLDDVKQAGSDPKYWQASAWILERRFPEKYGKRDTVRHEYTVKMQTLMDIVLEEVNKVSPDLKAQIIRRLKAVDTQKIMNQKMQESVDSKNVKRTVQV